MHGWRAPSSVFEPLESLNNLFPLLQAGYFLGPLGLKVSGTVCLVISAPVITALRIWPNRSVSVFGVWGIKMASRGVLDRSARHLLAKYSDLCLVGLFPRVFFVLSCVRANSGPAEPRPRRYPC